MRPLPSSCLFVLALASSPACTIVYCNDHDAVADAGSDVATSPVDAAEAASDASAVAMDADATVTDGPPADTLRCTYLAVEEVVARCSGRYTFVHREIDLDRTECTPRWRIDGMAPQDTQQGALSAGGCDDACLWHFALSVTWLRCGRRSGYEVLRAQDPRGDAACTDLYRFAEGYYPSVEAYDRANPCPDGG